MTVRGLQQLASRADRAEAVARVAVNLRSVERHLLGRGDCLLTPGAWWTSDSLDVALDPLLAEPHGEQVLHIGSASIPVRLRLLGARGGARHRPAQPGQADPGAGRRPGGTARSGGAERHRRGVRARPGPAGPDPARRREGPRHAELADGTATGLAGQVRRRGAASRTRLAMLGVPVADPTGLLVRGDWLIDPDAWQRWQDALLAAVDRHAAADPLHPEISEEAARQAVGLPEPRLLAELVAACGLRAEGGRIGRPEAAPALGAAEASLRLVDERLARNPFDAPERTELAELGLGTRDLAAAARTGRLLRLAPDLVVAPEALDRAVAVLRSLPQPFTASQARQALGTTRRVALPLLEKLDAAGLTVRLDGTLRTVRG